jgi:hypothetical protein
MLSGHLDFYWMLYREGFWHGCDGGFRHASGDGIYGDRCQMLVIYMQELFIKEEVVMKFLAYLILAVAVVAPLILGIWWLLWKLWLFVLPAIWSDGPENIIRPTYWLFAGMWVLMIFIGRMFRGSRR